MNGSPLKDVLAKVAELYGEQPDRVTISFPSGSRVRIESSGATATKAQDKLSAEDRKRFETWTARIMPFMRDKQVPLLRKQIAMGLKVPNNNTSGWFGRTIVMLIESGELIENDDGFLSVAGSELLANEGD